MIRLILGISLSMLLGCSNSTAPRDGQLAVRAAAPVLVLDNQTQSPVYYFALERELAAYADWIPCTQPEQCSGIGAGQSTTITYSQIFGYTTNAREAVVYWWHLVRDPKVGLRADEVRSIVVSL